MVILIIETRPCLKKILNISSNAGSGHTLSTVKKSCSYSYHSAIHEVGHNFGCHHDRDNGHNTHYDYGYGWLIGKSLDIRVSSQ